MSPDPRDSGVLWRLGNAEKRLDSVEKLASDIPVIRRDIELLGRERAGEFATRQEVEAVDERIDRFIVIVLGVFGTLTVFGLGTAVTLLTTSAG